MKPSKTYPGIDEQRDYYNRRWTRMARARFREEHLKNRIHAITRVMSRLNLDQPRVLEIGCGLGETAAALARFGEVTALDLSPQAIAIARQCYPEVRFFAANALTHPFEKHSYDVVVTSEVIEHLPVDCRGRFIEIIAHQLTPNGYLILTTPNKVYSERSHISQPIEEHFFADELQDVLSQHFDIRLFTTVHRLFPTLGAPVGVCSLPLIALRAGVYEILRLRGVLENPFQIRFNGRYFVVLAQRRTESK